MRGITCPIVTGDCSHYINCWQADPACLYLQGALLMCFLQKPLYLSSLTVLLNLPSSAVLLQQAVLQQPAAAKQQVALQQTPAQLTVTQQPALQQDAYHSNINTDRVEAVQTAVQRAVAGGCAYSLLC